jgi:hypothetical protein
MRLIPVGQLDSDAFGLSERARQALERANSIQLARHGFYASIPIICRGARCPYAATCQLLKEDLAPVGERCPLEIAAAQRLFQAYVDELKIDPDSAVDLTLVRELISLDIAILRCENKLAADADFVQEVAVAVTPRGHVITKPEIHRAAEYKDKLLEKRHRVLQLLNSTRKDKAGTKITVQYDPSVRAAELLKRAREYWDKRVIDAEVVEDGGQVVEDTCERGA